MARLPFGLRENRIKFYFDIYLQLASAPSGIVKKRRVTAYAYVENGTVHVSGFSNSRIGIHWSGAAMDDNKKHLPALNKEARHIATRIAILLQDKNLVGKGFLRNPVARVSK